MKPRLTIPWLLLPMLAAIVMVANTQANKATKATQKQTPLSVLQTSERILDDVMAKKGIAVSPKDGKSLYVLDQSLGGVIIYSRGNRVSRRLNTSVRNAKTFVVGPQNNIYIAGEDSFLRVFDEQGQELSAFPVSDPTSIAVLSSGNVIVASPVNGKLVHLFSPKGELIKSFGEAKEFDDDSRENQFLNKGKVLVGVSDKIYYITMYAPQPYVAQFSEQGHLVREFQIEGEAVDFQTGKAKDFLRERKFDCAGGVRVITAAAIDPMTGHLWVGMNGLATTGTLYEYDDLGEKIKEYAFLDDAASGRQNLTHLKDVAVNGSSINILSWDKLYDFNTNRTAPPDVAGLNNQPRSGRKTGLWERFINHFTGPASNPVIPQGNSCPQAQEYACTANCPEGSAPSTVDCKEQIDTRLAIGDIVTQSDCTRRTINSTPGASNPGGCIQIVSFCNPNPGGNRITGTISLEVDCNPVPTPTPTPTPPPGGGGGGGGGGEGGGCDPMWCQQFDQNPNVEVPICCGASPILIDVSGDGFDLTDGAGGVNFDLNSNGTREKLSWTAAGSDDAWLALDRDGNGTIDNGRELFGNFTPQPTSDSPHGFIALAEYDKAAQGGNSDGVIDSGDGIFSSLRLWRDANHNGVSETGELRTLAELGLKSIELDYKESKRTDEHGNRFRYRAKVRDVRGAQLGRWAWDVFLMPG